jgi:hypothetical protein
MTLDAQADRTHRSRQRVWRTPWQRSISVEPRNHDSVPTPDRDTRRPNRIHFQPGTSPGESAEIKTNTGPVVLKTTGDLLVVEYAPYGLMFSFNRSVSGLHLALELIQRQMIEFVADEDEDYQTDTDEAGGES